MQGVLWQNQPRTLLPSQTSFDQGEVEVRVAPVKFIAHDGMAEVRQVNADLMFAASPWLQP